MDAKWPQHLEIQANHETIGKMFSSVEKINNIFTPKRYLVFQWNPKVMKCMN